MERKNAWNTYDASDMASLEQLMEGYKSFLDRGKTERECAATVVEQARAAGFRDLEEAVREKTPLKAGDKVYYSQMGKSLFLAVIGWEPMERG